MKQSLKKRNKKKNGPQGNHKSLLEIWMPWILLVTVLGFFLLAPKFGVDSTKLVPIITPIITEILKK